MKEKNLFKLAKPILHILVLVIRILSCFIKQFIWEISAKYGKRLFIDSRYISLKATYKSVGDNVYVGKHVFIKGAKNIEIDNDVSIHDFCVT